MMRQLRQGLESHSASENTNVGLWDFESALIARHWRQVAAGLFDL